MLVSHSALIVRAQDKGARIFGVGCCVAIRLLNFFNAMMREFAKRFAAFVEANMDRIPPKLADLIRHRRKNLSGGNRYQWLPGATAFFTDDCKFAMELLGACSSLILAQQIYGTARFVLFTDASSARAQDKGARIFWPSGPPTLPCQWLFWRGGAWSGVPGGWRPLWQPLFHL